MDQRVSDWVWMIDWLIESVNQCEREYKISDWIDKLVTGWLSDYLLTE